MSDTRKHAALRSAAMSVIALSAALSAAAPASSARPETARHLPKALPHARYAVETIGKPLPLHGVQGLAFGPDGALYVCSVSGGSIHRVDVKTGAVTLFAGPPHGGADDIVFAADGTAIWVNYLEGIVYARSLAGEVRAIARDLSGVDGIAFAPDGRLYVSRVPPGDGLYEIDPAGIKPPRLIVAKAGVLNAFQIGRDGFAYGPQMTTGRIVKIDLKSGEISEAVKGFQLPSAVKFDAQGRMIVVEYAKGEIVRVDPATGQKTLLATLPPPVDNVAVGKDGKLYATSTAYNGITVIEPESGATSQIIWGQLSTPGFLSVMEGGAENSEADRLLIADTWGARTLDLATGKATLLKADHTATSGVTAILAMDKDYVVSINGLAGSGGVHRFDGTTGRTKESYREFGAAYGIAPVPSGIVVADFATGKLSLIGNDTARTRSVLPWQFDGPVGLAPSGTGQLYVTEFTGGRITRIDMGGKAAKTIVIDGLDKPEGLALTVDGKLLVAETGRKRILLIDPTTGHAAIVADRLSIGLAGWPEAPAPFLPTGVAVTRKGVIYVPGDIDNIIYRLSPR